MDDDRRRARSALTPLVVGIAVGVLGAVVAVASIFFLADPRVGVLAAFALSFGCVGVAAGLLLTQRRSWADVSWRADARDVTRSVRRTRRATLLYGAFLLLMSVIAGVATAGALIDGGVDDAPRGWIIVAILGLAGSALVIMGARRPPMAVSSSERPATGSGDDGEWVWMGPPRPRRLFAWWAPFSFSGQAFLLPYVLLACVPITALQFDVWAWASVAAALLVGAVVTVVVLRRQSRPPRLSRDAARLLVGGSEVETESIVSAMLVASQGEPDAPARSLALVLGTSGGERAVVALRDRGHLALTEEQTALLVAAIERSRIELPRAKDDPRGRFSRTLYPSHLTAADAVQVVERPPGDGDPLPISLPTV